ncbi:MAG: type II secretion system protein GspG [Candidatus Sumerlaeia bacterium]|nr:type II secretion system protein GspG [Candidatus Sumerlaeia bacterium]
MDAQVRAKAARAKNDLRTIAVALEAYHVDCSAYPPARAYCAGMQARVEDHNITPPELTAPIAYLPRRYWDVFNRDHAYKYLAPGRGWSNETLTVLAIWVPKYFPSDSGPADDVPYFDGESPVKWGIWSVGPWGAKTFYESDRAHIPVPPRTWYDPTNGTVSEGVISRLSTGHHSP